MFTFRENRLIFQEVLESDPASTKDTERSTANVEVPQVCPKDKLTKMSQEVLRLPEPSEDEKSIAEKIFKFLDKNIDFKKNLRAKGVSETLDVSDIYRAFNYDLGKYGKDMATLPEKEKKYLLTLLTILTAIQDKKIDGVSFAFVGGTDGTDFVDRKRSKEWHNKKEEAFKQVLDLMTTDNLSPQSVKNKFDTAQYKNLMKGYMTASDPDAYVDGNKDNFLPAGELFDLALAFQRANQLTESFRGAGSGISGRQEKVILDLETANKGKIYRKASVRFICGEYKTIVPQKTGQPQTIKYSIGQNSKAISNNVDNSSSSIDQPIFPNLELSGTLEDKQKAIDDVAAEMSTNALSEGAAIDVDKPLGWHPPMALPNDVDNVDKLDEEDKLKSNTIVEHVIGFEDSKELNYHIFLNDQLDDIDFDFDGAIPTKNNKSKNVLIDRIIEHCKKNNLDPTKIDFTQIEGFTDLNGDYDDVSFDGDEPDSERSKTAFNAITFYLTGKIDPSYNKDKVGFYKRSLRLKLNKYDFVGWEFNGEDRESKDELIRIILSVCGEFNINPIGIKFANIKGFADSENKVEFNGDDVDSEDSKKVIDAVTAYLKGVREKIHGKK